MEEYNASVPPKPQEWLALEDPERLDLVVAYVNKNEAHLEESARRMHAAIHLIVENQLASKIDPTPAVYARLKRQGLKRHEAIHAIGSVVSENMFALMDGRGNPDPADYSDRLKKLTARRWKKGIS